MPEFSGYSLSFQLQSLRVVLGRRGWGQNPQVCEEKVPTFMGSCPVPHGAADASLSLCRNYYKFKRKNTKMDQTKVKIHVLRMIKKESLVSSGHCIT